MFDGDVLNIMHIINQAFFERCYTVFNPRNAMYISRIDGRLNGDLLVQRDTLINANTFLHLGRDNYSNSQLDKIKVIKEKQKEYLSLSHKKGAIFTTDTSFLSAPKASSHIE